MLVVIKNFRVASRLNVILLSVKRFLLIALFAFPLLSLHIVHIVFIAFSLCVIGLYVINKPKFYWRDGLPYLFVFLLFVPFGIEYLLYSENTVMKFEVEKKLFFMIAPIVFFMNAQLKSKTDFYDGFYAFISSIAILSVVMFFYLLLNGVLLSETSYLNGAYELRRAFESASGLHPIYFGLFNTTASLWLLHEIKTYHNYGKRLMGTTLACMIIVNFLLAAKMPLFIFGMGCIWLVIKKVNKLKIALISILGLLFLFAIAIWLIPSLHNRFMEVYHFCINPQMNNTLLERQVIFDASRFAIGQNGLIGFGCRNTQAVLDYVYWMVRFEKGFTNHFNSHNQYFTFWLYYGIVYLLFFVSLLVMLFRMFKKHFFCTHILDVFGMYHVYRIDI